MITVYLPIAFLVASFIVAIIRRSVSAEVLAIWAIASAMLLQHLHLP